MNNNLFQRKDKNLQLCNYIPIKFDCSLQTAEADCFAFMDFVSDESYFNNALCKKKLYHTFEFHMKYK